MKQIDAIYAEVIFLLFGISLNSKGDIDSFYDSLEEKLSLEQIELLQVKMEEALHRPKSVNSQAHDCSSHIKTSMSGLQRLPSFSDVKEFCMHSIT